VKAQRYPVTAWLGVAISVTALATVGMPWESARLVGILLLAAGSIGAAAMSAIDPGDATVEAALVLVISLMGFTVVATLMLWLNEWHPLAAVIIIAVPSGLWCLRQVLVDIWTRAHPPLGSYDLEGIFYA
jgi:hypothetical protein